MRALLHRLRTSLRRLPWANEGVAAVEFALILPVMLLVYIGSVEASALISMDRRVQSVAGALGDLVARSDRSISNATLTDYFRAAGGIMAPYAANELRQEVTQVQVLANGTTRVVWSRQYSGGTQSVNARHTVGSSFALPAEMISIARGSYVIVSEGTYSYLPLYGIIYNQPIRLYRENFFMPRFGGAISIN